MYTRLFSRRSWIAATVLLLISGGEARAECNKCSSDDCEQTACGPCCDDGCEGWLDNTQFWLGGEAYKGIGETTLPPGAVTGFMASAGAVGGFNTGLPLGQSRIRAQIGGSYGVYDWKGRDTTDVGSAEQQFYVTAGFYKRSDICAGERLSWGVVYDGFFAHNWGLSADEVYFSQIRSITGYALNERNEVGFWGTISTNRDVTTIGTLRAMNQGNLYWRHQYEFGGQTMAYVGGADPADVASWQFGFLNTAPLSNNLSLYGNYTYSLPGSTAGVVGSNEYLWNFNAGLMLSFGGKAKSPNISGHRGLALLPVATNGLMLITD